MSSGTGELGQLGLVLEGVNSEAILVGGGALAGAINSPSNWDKLLEYLKGNGSEGSGQTNTLTDAQKSRLNSLDNTIQNNLKETDFSGTLRDLQGNPVPNPQGGYYDHLTEMKQSYTSLSKIKKGLEGSLKNPNLSSADRAILQEGLNQANIYIERIEQLFKPFGGIN